MIGHVWQKLDVSGPDWKLVLGSEGVAAVRAASKPSVTCASDGLPLLAPQALLGMTIRNILDLRIGHFGALCCDARVGFGPQGSDRLRCVMQRGTFKLTSSTMPLLRLFFLDNI